MENSIIIVVIKCEFFGVNEAVLRQVKVVE